MKNMNHPSRSWILKWKVLIGLKYNVYLFQHEFFVLTATINEIKVPRK